MLFILTTVGVQIENHGIVPFEQVIELYKQSKAIVYPSHNESLGLGIVEAITAGCDVISSDLPFTYAVCTPSVVFNPYLPESIANAIENYENNMYKPSELLIENQIDYLIKTLRGGVICTLRINASWLTIKNTLSAASIERGVAA